MVDFPARTVQAPSPVPPPFSADLDDGLVGLLVGDGFEDSKTNLTHDGSMGRTAFFTCI